MFDKLPGSVQYVMLNDAEFDFEQFETFLSYPKYRLEVIKLEHSIRLKIKRNDWLLADTCPQAANHCALF